MPKSLSSKFALSCAVAFGLLSFGTNAHAATITWAYTAQITDSNLEFPALFPPVPSHISGTFSFDSEWVDSNTNVNEAKYQGALPTSISANIGGQEFLNTSGNVIEVFDQGGGVFVSLLRTSASKPSSLGGNARYSGVFNIFFRDDNGDALNSLALLSAPPELSLLQSTSFYLNLIDTESRVGPNRACCAAQSYSGYLTSLAVAPTVPLPAALPLFAAGLGAMGFMGWRRKHKAAAYS